VIFCLYFLISNFQHSNNLKLIYTCQLKSFLTPSATARPNFKLSFGLDGGSEESVTHLWHGVGVSNQHSLVDGLVEHNTVVMSRKNDTTIATKN